MHRTSLRSPSRPDANDDDDPAPYQLAEEDGLAEMEQEEEYGLAEMRRGGELAEMEE